MVIEKKGVYYMELEIQHLQEAHYGPIIYLQVIKYNYVVEEGDKKYNLDGMDANVHSISYIHNDAIRRKLFHLLKHYGIDVFGYELFKTT
jgi:hypothetical protein